MVAYWNLQRRPKVFTRDTAIGGKKIFSDNDGRVKVEFKYLKRTVAKATLWALFKSVYGACPIVSTTFRPTNAVRIDQ